MRLHCFDWEARSEALNGVDLLVNTTSLGMVGQPPLNLSLSALPKTAVVTDIVYAPLITPLLEKARAEGFAIIDGLGMLLHQARPGFEAWFGQRPEVDAAFACPYFRGVNGDACHRFDRFYRHGQKHRGEDVAPFTGTGT